MLVVLAAVAAHGRPLGAGGRASAPDAGWFDYLFTTLVLLFAAMLAVTVVAVVVGRDRLGPLPRRRNDTLALLAFVVTAFVLALLLSRAHLRAPAQHVKLPPRPAQTTPAPAASRRPVETRRGAQLRWDEVVVVLAALAAVGVAAAVARRRVRVAPLRLRRAERQAVSLALDESLDDLRAEPDLRRAIVAAYARMERALAAGGLPRRPAEAPLEYLGRALLELETSAESVRRLTELFEWAKFSQHEPEPRMRDEAIDALAAVRDELRAPQAVSA